jgi:hypothetical protein
MRNRARTNAGGDGEDVGIEDDVLREEAHLLGQEAVRALADLELALGRRRLALLVELHRVLMREKNESEGRVIPRKRAKSEGEK